MKLLLAEDEKELSKALKAILESNRYSVDAVYDGEDAIYYMENSEYDAVILDIMMPKVDGITALKTVREKGIDVPIIMLTAKTEIEDVLEGLEIGADDYMKKPFDPRELVLRIKKFLRNKNREVKVEKYKFKNIEIDESRHTVTFNGEEIEFSKKEYDLLLLLVQNKDLVITRDKILDRVWNSNYYTGDRTVDVYISKLRDKIPELAECIKTVKGVGYKLEEKR